MASALVLDPSIGDPDLIIPAVGTSLEFDFQYTAGVGTLFPAEFSVVLFDSASSDVLGNFLTDTTSSGTVSFDLGGEVGRVLGLSFGLGIGVGGSLSIVTISDVELVSVIGVPEPSTLMLLGIGLVGLGWMRRRKKRS